MLRLAGPGFPRAAGVDKHSETAAPNLTLSLQHADQPHGHLYKRSRSSPRDVYDGLSDQADSGDDRVVRGRVPDVSSSGARIQALRPIRVGSRVRFVCGDGWWESCMRGTARGAAGASRLDWSLRHLLRNGFDPCLGLCWL